MEDLLNKASEWHRVYTIVARGHYLAADRKKTLNNWFGGLVIVITAVVGTSAIFGTLLESPDPFWRLVAGLLSLLGTVVASLQTWLGFAENADKHKAAGEAYRAISRSFAMFLLKHANSGSEQRQVAFAELEALVRRMNDLPNKFPSLPDRFYNNAKKEVSAQSPTMSAQQNVSELAA
jgi:hypothetical protein